MEFRFKKERLSMFTGTFPELTKEQWEIVRVNWSAGWKLFQDKVRYHLKEHNLYTGVVACFEIQEKRNSRTGALGLHVHMLLHARRALSGQWLMDKTLMAKLWRETWENFLGSRSMSNARCRTEEIVKTVAGYLGKYLSKGLAVRTQLESGTGCQCLIPVWYAVSNVVREWVSKATLKSATVGEFLRHELESDSEDILYKNWITLELMDGRIVPITCYGTSTYKNWDIAPP